MSYWANRVAFVRPMPVAKAQVIQQSPELSCDYVMRLITLRKRGLIGIVLVDQGNWWIASNPADPWGSKETVSVPELIRVIEHLEEVNP